MIDTDKYEGHTEGPWEIIEWEVPNPQWNVMLSCPEVGKFASIQGSSGWRPTEVDVELMADAPLLLKAYQKRLKNVILMREEIRKLNKIIDFAWEVMDDQTQVEFNDLIIELHGEEE